MPIELISGLLLLFALIICIAIYLVFLNILKFILSVRFIANLVNDFRKTGKKYLETEEYKGWNPWKFK
jgi:hypothetical protein